MSQVPWLMGKTTAIGCRKRVPLMIIAMNVINLFFFFASELEKIENF